MPNNVIEWLNENELRSYPLRWVNGKEVIVDGVGSVFNIERNAIGYKIGCNGPSLLAQVRAGDYLQVAGVRAEVLNTLAPNQMTTKSLYVASELIPANSVTTHTYQIVKKNSSLDTENDSVNLSLDGILLDANIVYSSITNISNAGKLLSINVVGNNLQLSIFDQPVFTVLSYKGASYPYYCRNSSNSLLVVGKAAKLINKNMSFVNQYLEASTISIMDHDWKGVSSLSFNSSPHLTGDISFEEGYQLGLNILQSTNTLKISAGKSFGTPLGCNKLYPLLVSDCPNIISYINSSKAKTTAGDFTLEAGNYVAIYPDNPNHRIYLGLTFTKADICQQLPIRPA